MARLMVNGDSHTVELTFDDEDGRVIATCTSSHNNGAEEVQCDWVDKYDDLNDATEYSQDHADRLVTYSNFLERR